MSYAGNTVRFAVGVLVGAACLVASERTILLRDDVLVTSAEARVGRPMTPMSYAGVARRTTRRAVAVGAAASSPVVVAPTGGCVQAVDAYGRIYTRCY